MEHSDRSTLRWRGASLFLISIALLFLLALLLFLHGSPSAMPHHGNATSSHGDSGLPSTYLGHSASVVPASTRNYSLNQPDVGVMQPAVDQAGNIWFGEMFDNALARLNPHTNAVSIWIPPHGRNNIMEVAIDHQGAVWFTEQAANYIGRFDPSTQRFTTYPLGQVDGNSSAPQDLKFDDKGNLWFTEVNGARIGRLNPSSGTIDTWPVPSPASGTPSLPFCLAVTDSGQIWFGYLSGGAIGEIDPATGAVHVYHLASSQTQVYAMNVGGAGTIWFSELQGGNLGEIDTGTSHISEIPVPRVSSGPATGMYDVQIGANGTVWLAIAGDNSLVSYTPSEKAFTFYQLATPGSVPFGLAFDGTGRLWFTASGTPNYIGVVQPL